MFWMSLFNLFFGSVGLMNVQLYLGLLVMCGFVLYDTQLIVAKAQSGNLDYLSHAIELFIDFVGIFVRLVIILTQKEDNRSREKKDNTRR